MTHEKTILAVTAALLLSACTQMVEGGEKASNNVKSNLHATGEKLKDIFTYHPPAPKKKPPVPPAYCYRVMQDVVCYRDPQAGAEARLVGYQASVEEPEAPVSTAPQEPPPPVMDVQTTVLTPAPGTLAAPDIQPLTAAPEAPLTAQQAAEKRERTEKSMERYAHMKPVFVGGPPPVQEAQPVELVK